MEARIVTGAAGSPHVLETPLTTPVTEEVSPDLLIGDIDSRIVKIRPMATPVDQISRLAPARKCKSMKLEYYSVDTLKSTRLPPRWSRVRRPTRPF